MIKFVPWVCVLAAGVAGWIGLHWISVVILSLVSTLSLASARKIQADAQTVIGKPNRWVDGAYLFAIQFLILFFVYNLVWVLFVA